MYLYGAHTADVGEFERVGHLPGYRGINVLKRNTFFFKTQVLFLVLLYLSPLYVTSVTNNHVPFKSIEQTDVNF
jgi:hypothetical protein